ncbi:MAG: hypothetical protein KTR17_08225, partial [Cellvibrionaceae bacterium]|nr:hypothetical protein [Cellvibrionaceae bacterium]
SDTPEGDWLSVVAQHNNDAALVVMGESEPLSYKQFAKLVDYIQEANCGPLKHLEMVVFHAVDDLSPLVAPSRCSITIKDQCNGQPHASILTRLFQAKEQTLNAAHLSFQVGYLGGG